MITTRVVWLALAVLAATAPARAEDFAAMLSQYRHAHGLAPVKADAQLTAVAERQARAMAARGVMDHNVAGAFSTRIAEVAVGGAGENLAEGTTSWADTLQRWEDSSGHNSNLLLAGATHVGIAVAYDSKNVPFRAMVIARKLSAEEIKMRQATPVLGGWLSVGGSGR
jgi:uncharacterized protein YkwD